MQEILSFSIVSYLGKAIKGLNNITWAISLEYTPEDVPSLNYNRENSSEVVAYQITNINNPSDRLVMYTLDVHSFCLLFCI